MATPNLSLDENVVLNGAPSNPHTDEDTIEARRARRMAALRKTAGMWADRKDIPADGLEYQREMRAEWR